MLVGYVSPTDPFKDRKSWSGTYYNTREALEKAGHQVEWVSYTNWTKTDKFFAKVYKAIYGRKGSYIHSRLASHIRTRTIKQDLSKYDVLFVPGQVDIVAGLKTDTPIIYYTDGTVPLMVNYYWFGFTKKAIKEAELVEQRAIDNASYVWLSSKWAADSVIKDYHADPNQVSVFPFVVGNNDEQKIHVAKYDGQTLKVMFSGVDWKRKGGQYAVDAVETLNQRGIKSELLITGIRDLPEAVKSKKYVKNLGFLNKNELEGLKKYLATWQEANLLLLPTRAECSAIVFCEAAAYGAPVLTTETGGNSTYVKKKVNGDRLPLSASGAEFADVLEKWVKNGDLDRLSQGAEQMYRDYNSWEAWGDHFNQVVR